jgi:transposase-like protein
MARHRRLSLEFKRQIALDFLEKRLVPRELSRKHNCPAICSASG